MERLLNSKLPPLVGTLPINTSMLLRTLVLHDVDIMTRERDRDNDWVGKVKEEAVRGTCRLLTVRTCCFPFLFSLFCVSSSSLSHLALVLSFSRVFFSVCVRVSRRLFNPLRYLIRSYLSCPCPTLARSHCNSST